MSVLHTDGRTDMWIKSSIRRMVWNGQEMVGESVADLILELAFLFSLQKCDTNLVKDKEISLWTYKLTETEFGAAHWMFDWMKLVNSTKN